MLAVYDLELHGAVELRERYDGIAARTGNLTPALERVERRLEEGEKRLFDYYNGHFVDTGDVMRSLTEPVAEGAIRQIVNGEELVFGTSIDYAVYLPGRAVLGLSDFERHDSGRIVLDYVTGEAVSDAVG